ncbi:hypothetical protein L873DRAFT_1451833 [Choiromyces venosus 120613-1]|uniref:Galactose oxidase n=1 Tax=Choiromyces venosus 120613-1 TaxID=1336337 RepID=A0A3N4K4M0_9PEZI|nr:hypothetical protein L873DRAFT_1451833 [Choiromyces venosus 120613-1]
MIDDKLLFHDLGNDDKGIPPLVNNLTKPSNVPSVIGGQLWADQANEKLYLFGGEYADNPPDSSLLWAYDTWNDSWTQVTPGFNGQGEMKRASFGAGAVVEHMGMGYYLGGWIGPQSVVGWNGDKYAVPGLISFDMVKNVLRNDSGPAGDPRVEGVLLYVPTGDDGLLISFGGYYAKGGKDPVGAPMNEIDVYDVNQKVWHRVMTSGQYPESRRRFCGGVTSASDGSSHNAYIYGGASTNSRDKGFDDIWVLTMPAFQWVKWWVHEPPNIHNGFSCNVIRKGQMIVLGGTFPYDQSVCDAPTAWGAHNMDLGQANPESAEWYGYKKNLSTYSVPQKIINIVGGRQVTLKAYFQVFLN